MWQKHGHGEARGLGDRLVAGVVYLVRVHRFGVALLVLLCLLTELGGDRVGDVAAKGEAEDGLGGQEVLGLRI